jgi:hypothetical protein
MVGSLTVGFIKKFSVVDGADVIKAALAEEIVGSGEVASVNDIRVLNYSRWTYGPHFNVEYVVRNSSEASSTLMVRSELAEATLATMNRLERASLKAFGLGVAFAVAMLVIGICAILTTSHAEVTEEDLQQQRVKAAMEYDLTDVDLNNARTVPPPLAALLTSPHVAEAIAVAHAFVQAGLAKMRAAS